MLATTIRPIHTMLLMLLMAPGLAFAGESCGRGQVPYSVDWTSNAENERSLSGRPTVAFATSPYGPELPVAMRFTGLIDRFQFDSPSVEGIDGGYLQIEQALFHHDEFTAAEIYFDRDIHSLSFLVEDFDQGFKSDRSYQDRLAATGQSRRDPGIVTYPSYRTVPQSPQHRYNSRVVAQVVQGEANPVHAGTYSDEAFDNIAARFALPVDRIRIEFGSTAADIGRASFGSHPAPQRIAVSNMRFCVNADNS